MDQAKMISLKTADGVVFEVEPAIAMEIETVQHCIAADDDLSSTAIPLPNVSSIQMKIIIEYLKQHRAGAARAFDADFVKPLSLDELRELLIAVHYLNVKGLHDLLTQTMADRIKNKSVEFVRRFFDIENDLTPEEETKLREENAWAFTGVDEDDEV